MASGKAIGTTLVLGGGGATAGAAMGGAFSSSKEQQEDSKKISTSEQPSTATVTTIQKPADTEIDKYAKTHVFNEATYQNKIIDLIKKDNLEHLVKAIGADNKKNEQFWGWNFNSKYKNRAKTNLDPIFGSITSGYSKTPVGGDKQEEALNQACDKAYKQQEDKYLFGANQHLLANIGEFCVLSQETQDISEPKAALYETNFSTANGFENGVLSHSSNLTKLVKHDVTNNKNSLWFNWAFHNIVSGSTDEKDTLFTGLQKGHVASSEDNSLVKACSEAYKKTYWSLKTSNAKLLNNIKKFCTPNKEPNNTIALPAWKEPTVTKFIKEIVDKETTQPQTYTSNFAKHATNKEVLVDPAQEEEWWHWKYENVYAKLSAQDKGKLMAPFEALESAKGENKSLSSACKTAYNYTKDKLEPTSGTEGKDKPLAWIKKLCLHSSKENTQLDNNS